MAGETLSFGPFSLIASQRLLMRGGAPVELGARALDILIALASRPNEVIGKKELIAQVWPDVIVEEGNLRFHVAALRKALGDGRDGARYIATLAGRGYCFVAPVSVLSSRPDTNGTAAAALPALNVPPRLLRMVGRADDVQAISTELIASRFVSVVGPGGVGKTTVAVAVAHHMLQAFAGAALFLDLTAMGNPDVTAASLASLLGISVQSKDPTASLIAYLRDKRLLLVFDNCEHIIDAAAALTEGIFREAPDVNILTTSREALRVEGEKVYRLPPLLVPPENPGLTAAAALTYPAVQLFVERAAASGARIVLQDADVATVASICRRLDGMALAIELAAGRVAGYGLQQTAALLDERLSLMWLGQRTAPPRQKTLQATLDWSHGLLSAEERIVLRRLAAFVGYFTLEATRAVATSATVDEALVLNAIDSLVAKSMVVVVPGTGSTMRYRLLDASRAYARVKLVESGEAEAVARRHVVYYRDLLQRTDTRSSPGDRSERRAALAEHLGNVRAALEWSLADRGDVELGIQLAAVSAALFIELSLLSEYCRWTGRALSALDAGTRGSRWEMELQAGLAHCIMYTKGNGEEAQSALERASVIAEALGDGPGQLRVLTRLHMHLRRAGYFGRLLPVAQQIEAIASSLGDPIGVAAAHGILGASHHLVGNQARASHNLDASLRGPSEFRRINASHFGFHFDPHIPLARVLWLQGYPDKAVQAAIEVTREGAPYQDPVTLCVALIWGMAVYQWTGDWARVEECTARLIAQAERHSLEPFQAVGLGLQGQALMVRGEVRGMELLRESLARQHAERYELYTAEISCAYAASLAGTGDLDRALETITETISAVVARGESFMMPEMLRVKGELLWQAADRDGAEDCFLQSLALADQQFALSWRLRTSTSFARLPNKGGGRSEAQSELARTYARFREGFNTADLRSAKLLLDNMDQPIAC